VKKYSLESMILELEKLYVIEEQNGNLFELASTKKRKDILEPLDKNLWL
jgi:hypothetical protein